jgi:hypothetical protein
MSEDEPIRVIMYGDGFASIDGAIRMTAFGPGALQTIVKKLLAIGYSPDQRLEIHRGGQPEGRLLLRDASKNEENA